MQRFLFSLLPLLTVGLLATACERRAEADLVSTTTEVSDLAVEPRIPEWEKDAVIYEVNLRHFTPEGTFAAFENHIPRLAEMGVDILWFMPVHPISEKNRKGELGSPYAAADYKGVNPDFGTMEDFKSMIDAIHAAGMYAIIDWIPNHSGWDNPWITEHPDFYTKKDGKITDPINPHTGESWGWTDVADLNYDNPELRDSMIAAMAFWVREANVDGFRVDVAHGIPVDFIEQAADSLYRIRPLFMLAEAEVPEIVNNGAFVMDYGWEMHHVLNQIARSQGAHRAATTDLSNIAREESEAEDRVTALEIDRVLAKYDSLYDRGYKMMFTSNHDENSWAGTEFQRMGEGHKAFAVLTATFSGMPLIYTGQESAVDKQFEFFTKDEVEWGNYKYADFYRTLFELKERNQALWNGPHGGELVKIQTGTDENVYAFTREKNGDRVVVMINLSATPQSFELGTGDYAGTYTDVFANEQVKVQPGQSRELGAWEYVVLSNK
ncbi:glycosidase [Lewinella marina]|uniref:Alpha-amylase n=1 Tax=Neolewinella marina TaxID=438751 RepID=A0A2G0CHB0_9BACT|nr:alpha-amylase family glycosyl hydrolase [Neolewinella marina]NJB86175.1 glycosidase [Neolewinella marina]PHK99348.1 alpha-amylase [Neolewinella marina]